jgi:hypothetical protein
LIETAISERGKAKAAFAESFQREQLDAWLSGREGCGLNFTNLRKKKKAAFAPSISFWWLSLPKILSTR